MAVVVGPVGDASDVAPTFEKLNYTFKGVLPVVHHYKGHETGLFIVRASEENLARQHFLRALQGIKLTVLPVKSRYHYVVNTM